MTTERRRARAIGLEILYQKDIVGCSMADSIAMRRLRLSPEEPELPEFSVWLAEKIDQNLTEIDNYIMSYADNWVIDRMPIIDRNLLRISICEMLFASDVPTSVSINEAVELAKEYSTPESGKFINGVLGRIAKELEEPKVHKGTDADGT